jgi:GGDEF domain-containing protein
VRTHLVVRSGGEEFIILLDGLSEMGEAKKVAAPLRGPAGKSELLSIMGPEDPKDLPAMHS